MSFGELLFFFFLALMVFGPRRLPEIARTVAKLMAELRRASNEFRYSLEEEVRALEIKETEQKRAALPPPPAVIGAVARPLPDPPAASPAAEPLPPPAPPPEFEPSAEPSRGELPKVRP